MPSDGHGDTGGDGKTFIALWLGERQSEIGGKTLVGVKEDREFESGSFAGLDIGLKVSSGLASGGDIRLAIGGRRFMLDGLY